MLPVRIFQSFGFNEFKSMCGVSTKTAEILTTTNILSNLGEIKSIQSSNDLNYIVKLYNKNNKKIRYNFIKNDIIKMKNGNVYSVIYLQ
jgi:hypothetical protein